MLALQDNSIERSNGLPFVQFMKNRYCIQVSGSHPIEPGCHGANLENVLEEINMQENEGEAISEDREKNEAATNAIHILPTRKEVKGNPDSPNNETYFCCHPYNSVKLGDNVIL